MSKLQSGQVYNYAFTIILFTTFYLHSLTIHLNVEYLIIIPILIFLLS
jgi:hypothetical protein